MTWLISFVTETLVEAIAVWIAELAIAAIAEWLREAIAAIAEWLREAVTQLIALLSSHRAYS
ncbi:MAG: hypothetical protein N4J56_004324 [Chroococcidiopsis sp. SAG 2025]|uniref:hypothetical protein n=1 Tax=Chroococcidiopsis sp. SAG 2025 TaxID=171389 RepID=UPI00293744E2|nr:hypothetical protein [Chroococcidiopsis sp. SAG 2025]MDV2994670.1 hypothetical protein [Chroococcidiopsis sp. SAG 2025]